MPTRRTERQRHYYGSSGKVSIFDKRLRNLVILDRSIVSNLVARNPQASTIWSQPWPEPKACRRIYLALVHGILDAAIRSSLVAFLRNTGEPAGMPTKISIWNMSLFLPNFRRFRRREKSRRIPTPSEFHPCNECVSPSSFNSLIVSRKPFFSSSSSVFGLRDLASCCCCLSSKGGFDSDVASLAFAAKRFFLFDALLYRFRQLVSSLLFRWWYLQFPFLSTRITCSLYRR